MKTTDRIYEGLKGAGALLDEIDLCVHVATQAMLVMPDDFAEKACDLRAQREALRSAPEGEDTSREARQLTQARLALLGAAADAWDQAAVALRRARQYSREVGE